jgi:hypothetical protein
MGVHPDFPALADLPRLIKGKFLRLVIARKQAAKVR